MTRPLSTIFKDASTEGVIYAAVLTELEFDEGVVRLWAGLGELEWDGKTFYGAGALLNLSPAQETQNLEATNCAWELSGIDQSIVSAAASSNYSGRPCRFWLGFFDTDWQLQTDPQEMFEGTMDTMPVTPDPNNPVIRLNAENDLYRLTQSRERRLTHEEQQNDYPGDMFFEYVTDMQDKEIVWQ